MKPFQVIANLRKCILYTSKIILIIIEYFIGPRTATTSIADDEEEPPVCDENEIHSETHNDAENVDVEGITNVDPHKPIHFDH